MEEGWPAARPFWATWWLRSPGNWSSAGSACRWRASCTRSRQRKSTRPCAPSGWSCRAPAWPISRADFTRLTDALGEQGFAAQELHAHPSVLRSLPEILREEAWRLTAYVRGDEIVGFGPVEERALGLCVDLGTTKIAASLVDLATGRSLGSTGAPNPQMGYGEDVISRINHLLRHPETAQILAEKVQKTLNDLLGELLAQASERQAVEQQTALGQQPPSLSSTRDHGLQSSLSQQPPEGQVSSLEPPEARPIQPAQPNLPRPSAPLRREQVVEACIVGNTAMIHLLLRLPVRQLASAPYVAAVSGPLEVRAGELGLEMAPGAYAYIPPNVGGFVGADHVAMILACDLDQGSQLALGIDIGTNTEIVLRKPGEAFLTSASCASGPAFEGAHISEGMRAASGAIEKVRLTADGLELTTIDQDPPVGLCGSGIVDTLAELHRWGLINRQGSFQRQYGRIRSGKNGGEFVLAYAGQSGTGRDIVIDQKDVNEIQLAKGAICAGLQVLLEMSGTAPEDVQEVIIAGAFGSFLNIEHAAAIGLFPRLPNARFRQVGNAALVGARWMLVSKQARERALQIQANTRHQHLNTYPRFNRLFAQGMLFPDR